MQSRCAPILVTALAAALAALPRTLADAIILSADGSVRTTNQIANQNSPCSCEHDGPFAVPRLGEGNPGAAPPVDCPACQMQFTDCNGNAQTYSIPAVHATGTASGDAHRVTLQVTGSGGPIDTHRPCGFLGEPFSNVAGSLDISFVVSGQPTLVDISIGALDVAAPNCSAAITLRRGSTVIGQITNDGSGARGTLPAGPLIPGSYGLSCQVGGAANLPGPSALSFNVSITVDTGPATHNFHWITPAGGDFGARGNWNPAQVPGPADAAIFDLTNTTTPVPVNAAQASVAHLLVQGMRLELTGSAGASGSPGLAISHAGELLLDNGGVLTTPDGTVGGPVGSAEALVIVRGTGTHWTIGSGNPLVIGPDGPGNVLVDFNGLLEAQKEVDVGTATPGTLRVENGGQVHTPNCTLNQGSVQVRGQGAFDSTLNVDSTLNIGGQNGAGSVILETGGKLNAAQMFVGSRAVSGASTVTVSGQDSNGSPSTLALSGAGSRLDVSGDTGTQVEVQDGGLLTTAGPVVVGRDLAIGKVFVHGQFAKWEASDNVFIGGKAAASELVVQNAGHVTVKTANQTVIGSAANELGHVTVSGTDAVLATGVLAVGADGHGELTISSGGKVTTTGQGQVGLSNHAAATNPLPTSGGGGLGVVTIDGSPTSPSQWHVAGDCFIGQDEPGTITLRGTTVFSFSVGGATLKVDGTLTVGRNGLVNGFGTLTAGQRVVNGGIISPGLSPGVIEIDGDYEQTADGVLKIEVGALDTGQFDVLKVTGNATLAGKVDLQFVNGFVPKPGDNVDFVQVSGTITGKLTGDTLVPAGTDPATGQSTAQATVKWDVTPNGTCRMTVTDVQASNESALGIPGTNCGAGMCGAGMAPMLPLTLAGLTFIKLRARRASAARPHPFEETQNGL